MRDYEYEYLGDEIMGFFEKFKKKQNTEAVEINTVEAPCVLQDNDANTTNDTDITESTNESDTKNSSDGMCMGILDTFSLQNHDDLVVVGKVKGTVHAGQAICVTNCGEEDEETVATIIVGIETGPGVVADKATDCHVGLRIQNGKQLNLKKGTVLYTPECSEDEIRNAYTSALGDTFVAKQELEISEKDMDSLSLADCAEIWRLFIWFQTQVVKQRDEEKLKVHRERLKQLAIAMGKKLLVADSIYCVYSKATGEPYMFSQTVRQENGNYMCTPPHILVVTKKYEKQVMQTLPADKFEMRCIENGEDKQGIYNFLGSTFYLNGACEVAIQAHQSTVAAEMIVQKPDYSQKKPINVPVTNPNLVRWMLLIGQMGKPEGEDQDLIYRLYYRFMSMEMTKANFLIPMKHDGEMPKTDEDGKTVLKEGMSMQFPTMDGKYGRPAVRMFTDWKRLRMAFNEEWSGMIQPISGMIGVFDCAINATEYPQAGCYVGQEMFEDMQKFSQKKMKE